MNHVLQRGRRRFLVGTGGALLPLPVLPSLFTAQEARAQTRTQKNFIQLITPHGGVLQSNMFPAAQPTTSTYAGRAIRRGSLSALATTASGETRLSEVLRAPSDRLSAALLGKMNVLNGLDIPFYIGHHEAGCLGNFATSNEGGDFVNTQGSRVTIDQVMAFSSGFDPNPPALRSVYIGQRAQDGNKFNEAASYEYSHPLTLSGVQHKDPTAATNLALFDVFFPPPPPKNGSGTGSAAPTTAPLVDRVLDSVRSLRANPRLSSLDRQRLDDHIARVAELQRKLQGANQPATPSGRPPQPADSTANHQAPSESEQNLQRQLWNDVFVLGLAAGTSHIVVYSVGDDFAAYTGTQRWHEDAVHSGIQTGPDSIVHYNQRFFANVVVDLAAKLDSVDMGDGSTLLDRSLFAWSQECGDYTHKANSMPVITFGKAAGFLNTGLYCDYRDLTRTISDGNQVRHIGLLWHQWLGTALQAMGVPKSDYEGPTKGGITDYTGAGNPGYPYFRYDTQPGYEDISGSGPAYPDAVWSAAGDVLPFLQKS